MDVYEALYTTRAMRRVTSDPIPEEVQKKILDAAIRAPSGGNSQTWRVRLVDDKDVLGRLGPVYRACLGQVFTVFYGDRVAAALAAPDEPESVEMLKMKRSAEHLAEHFEDYPLMLFSFSLGDPTGGSIHPSTWSACLAARAEGVGSAWTSAFALDVEPLLEILGVPADQGWKFASCVTFGYPTGKWGVAPRVPVHEVSYRNHWGTPVGFEIPAPLWSY